jgi:thiol-disulfide isomerase/thioredoxin
MSVVGVAVLVAVLLAATAYGLARRGRTGRLADTAAETVRPETIGAEALGERATLVQFSSAFCRPCVATRHVLGDVAGRVPGVRHVEVDAESNLELVRSLNIASTPTTLVLDSTGVVRRRAVGVPKRDEVLATLAALD